MIENYIEPKYIRNSSDLKNNIQLGITTESIFMDFKLNIDISSPSKKKSAAEEFALDICQFANTWGGVLLFGVDETKSAATGKKVAQDFPGITNFEELSQFINDSVLPLIFPKEVKVELMCLESPSNTQLMAINVLPLALGISCVYNISPPYSQKFPYRTPYGKKYFHPLEVEKRMSTSNRSVPIKLEDLCRHTREVTLYPKIEKEPIDKPEKWDVLETVIVLNNVSSYEFSLKISGIVINIPFSLVRDVWLTENERIGILLNTRLIIASDRKRINLDL
ncbi:MAG: ATP-binding protein [Anaerolineaceae bacterium]|nr:ATP-binding protein [Anaerolineaceae bacterium]